MKNFEFSKYCTPAQLYLVIGVICIISGFFTNYSIETLLTQALFLVIWAWVLNWLCSKGFKAISWIIVLLPFIFFLFMYFLIKDIVVVKEGFVEGICSIFLSPSDLAKCISDEKAAQDAINKATQAVIEAEKKRQADAYAAAVAAAAAEKKRKEEAAALAKCNGCLAKKTRSQCTPTYCKA